MGKKREDRQKGKKLAKEPGCNLDAGYESPVRSFHDITAENVLSLLVHSRYVQALTLLTVIGFFLRFYNLGFNSLWLDEASTYTFASLSFPQIWQATAGGEFNPPLFYWAEHGMLVSGNSEFILRLVPALLGALTVPLLYCAGREFLDRNTGLIAAAACAFSPFLLIYSQEARAYSVMLFFVTFALVFYFRAIRENDIRNWILFALLSAQAFWSHFYAFVIIAAMVLYALYLQVRKGGDYLANLRPIALAVAAFTALCLPLIIVTIPLFASRTSSGSSFGIQGLAVLFTTFQQLSGFSDILMAVFAVLFLLGIVQAFIVEKNKGIFLLSMAVLTFLISMVLSYKMPMVPRYLIFFSSVYYIGIAASWRMFCTLVSTKAVVYAFVALFVFASAPFLATYYSGYSKEDWRGFSGQVQGLTQPGDVLVVVPAYVSQPLNYYYSNRTDGTFEYGAYTAAELEGFAALQTNSSTVYYVVTGDIGSADPTGGAAAWLQGHTTQRAGTPGVYLLVNK